MVLLATILCISVILLAYAFLLDRIAKSWRQYTLPKEVTIIRAKVAVIVAARNEEETITSCIRSILENEYPQDLLELIVVDDHSTDSTLEKVRAINSDRLIVLQQAANVEGKKKALQRAIDYTDAEIIITTDADCMVGREWLTSMVQRMETENLDFVTSIVAIDKDDSILSRYQSLDTIGMMGVTQYGIKEKKYYLANGANMGFRKSIFNQVQGFEGNEHLASGDDLFLIQKISKVGRIGFLKKENASVCTLPVDTCNELFSQRKRWATKSKNYSDVSLNKLLGFIFLCNVLILLLPLLGCVWGWSFLGLGIGYFLIKSIIDYWYLRQISENAIYSKTFDYFLLSSFISAVIVIYSGVVGLFPSKYRWKDRTLR